MKIAFYAPMKPPDHPTPSGDRRIARLMMQALRLAGHDVTLASTLRVYDGKGDRTAQEALVSEATDEADRFIGARDRPNLWFTYHCYYKAPDLIGPHVAKACGIPYAIAEASRAKKRLDGSWALFAEAAEHAIDAAQVLFALSGEDRYALDRERAENQQIVDLPPFIDPGPGPKEKPRGDRLRLITVAMMREGAKYDSYHALAEGLGHLDLNWHLTVIGDGEARGDVEALFAPFGEQVTFEGAITDETALRTVYEHADVFVWPGIGEALGMVYLEAQAAGIPVIAEDRPGPRSLIAPDYALTPPGDARALANAIADAPSGRAGRDHVLARHSLAAAAKTLDETLRART